MQHNIPVNQCLLQVSDRGRYDLQQISWVNGLTHYNHSRVHCNLSMLGTLCIKDACLINSWKRGKTYGLQGFLIVIF